MDKIKKNSKSLLLNVFRIIIIVGICYVILGPVIGILSSSFFSADVRVGSLAVLTPHISTLL